MHNPHDKRYKELLSNKKAFISFLKDCISEPWVFEITENDLRKSNTSFILQDFTAKEADVVYEVSVNGRKIIFYILVELQSTVDYRMSYRLMLYVVEILRDYYNKANVNERDNKEFKFPAVIPVVFYSGNETWTLPTNIREMFENFESFGNRILNFEYVLVAAKNYTEEQLKSFCSKLLAIAFMFENSKTTADVNNGLMEIIKAMNELDQEEKRTLNVFLDILDMIYGSDKKTVVKKLLEDGNSKEAESLMYDILENDRIERESLFAKGKFEGKAEGKAEGKLETAKNMILENMPIDFILKITGLSKDQIDGIVV
ncbi:MAG: Rpn family recombination-promoting nuclease/putative transposase [Clostridiales bacterium]|jgi:predicted transposase/invertase (TIGR01784 family)|nr:Rpn family recombination-promoting nuclease/putative transposase [Clostridiales bacterium]